MDLGKQEEYFSDWKQREELAEAMLPIVGRLYRDHGIVTTVYGRSLVHGSMVDILKAHRFARQILENELSVRDTFPVLRAMENLDLAPSRIDIGKLTVRLQAQGPDFAIRRRTTDDRCGGAIDRVGIGHAIQFDFPIFARNRRTDKRDTNVGVRAN